jgi:hypothetical protein
VKLLDRPVFRAFGQHSLINLREMITSNAH